MIYWLQGNQRRSWANDCEGEGEGQAEERPRHRQDVRVHHGRRRHGGEVGKGGQENVLFSYVFISGRLNRERNSDESERQWKLARRKRRCGKSVKKTYFCCFTVSTFLICVSCDIGWAANGNNPAGTWPWRGLRGSEKGIEREGIVGVFGGWGDCHLHQEPLGSLDLGGF